MYMLLPFTMGWYLVVLEVLFGMYMVFRHVGWVGWLVWLRLTLAQPS